MACENEKAAFDAAQEELNQEVAKRTEARSSLETARSEQAVAKTDHNEKLAAADAARTVYFQKEAVVEQRIAEESSA